jgi:hypothetical protein
VQPHAPVAGAAVRIGTNRGPAGRSAEKGDPSSRRPPATSGFFPVPGGPTPGNGGTRADWLARAGECCACARRARCVEWQPPRWPPVRAGLRGSDPGPATGGPRADGPPAVPDPSGRWRAPDPAPGVAVREVLDAPGLAVWSPVRAAGFPAPESPAQPALLGGPTRFWLATSTASRPPPRCRTPPTAWFPWRRWPPWPRCGGDLGGDAGPARAARRAHGQRRRYRGVSADGLPADGSLDNVVPVLTSTSDIHPNGATSGGHVRAVPIVSGPTGGHPREELP